MHKQWQLQENKESTNKKVEDYTNGAKCYECGSPNHKRNQCSHRNKDGRKGNKGGGNQNNGKNGKPKGNKCRDVCNHCDKRGHEEKRLLEETPRVDPGKFCEVVGLNVPANTEHVFGFKYGNFAHTSTNILDLESFMDNGDNLNNFFLVKKEENEIKEHHQFSQIGRDDMYKRCRVNREGYEFNTEIYNQNQKKMAEALNEAELVRLTAERHFMETKHDLEYLRMQGSDCAMPERLLKEREFKASGVV